MTSNTFIDDIKQGFNLLPKALRYLLAINIMVFLVGLFGLHGKLMQWFGYLPNIETTLTQPWRIVTYTFIHSMRNPFHIVFNMLILWFFGKPVEQAMGTRSFTALYFISAIGGALIQMTWAHISGDGLNIPVIGASGAVMGVTAAFGLFLFPNMQVLFFFIPMPARYLVALLIAMDLLFIGSGDNVARLVHIGGAGIASLVMYYRAKGYDVGEIIEVLGKSFKPSPKNPKQPKNSRMHKVQDVEVIDDTAQEEIDRILDKISRTGYEGLTAEEKKTLFELSKRK